MQLHPDEPGEAVKHCAASLAAGYIGLDFASDVGDLLTVDQSALPERQRDYWAFAHEMMEGEKVLVIAHQFPFALVTIDGPYNFIRRAAPELRVWFRHFRKVRDVRFYADYVTNARNWESITMTDTISPLRDPQSKSYQLIESWGNAI
jgi:hypothetical protein